jgi:hypothetical protein
MIRKTASFAYSLAVLSMLECDERLSNHKDRWNIEAYQNGREQGITIWNSGSVAYYVAQYRRSDQMVV